MTPQWEMLNINVLTNYDQVDLFPLLHPGLVLFTEEDKHCGSDYFTICYCSTLWKSSICICAWGRVSSSSCWCPTRTSSAAFKTKSIVAAVNRFTNWFCDIFSDPSEVGEKEADTSQPEEREVAEGFGKLYPCAQESQQHEEHSEDELDLTSDVISRKELEKGRLSRDGECSRWFRDESCHLNVRKHLGFNVNKTDQELMIETGTLADVSKFPKPLNCWFYMTYQGSCR